MKEARRECVRKVTLSTGTLGILMFGDDMVMMAETKEALQHNVEAMNEALIRWDLQMNMGWARQIFVEEEELSKQTKLKVLNATTMLVFMHECKRGLFRKSKRSRYTNVHAEDD